MKYSVLFVLLSVCISACNNKQVDPLQRPLKGTYSVTHLDQYQDGKPIFSGNLPATLGDTVIIKHALSIELSVLKSSDTDAFINYSMSQEEIHPRRPNVFYSRSYGRSIAGNKITIKPSRNPGTFDFYKTNEGLLGSSDGNTLSFDFTEPDSLGHTMRYVYEARKSNALPNRY